MGVNVRRWHWGKIVILWAWGGVAAALSLVVFLSSPANQSPAISAFTSLGSLAILLVLSSVTWVWLGAKDGKEK